MLDRIADRGDTREATSAEIAVACSEVSVVVPLGTAGLALYMRTWVRAFPDQAVFDAAMQTHYAYVAGDAVDKLDAFVRRHLRQPGRTLDAATCRAGTSASHVLTAATPDRAARLTVHIRQARSHRDRPQTSAHDASRAGRRLGPSSARRWPGYVRDDHTGRSG